MKYWDVPWNGTTTDTDSRLVGELLDALGTSTFGAMLYQLINDRVPVDFINCGAVNMGEPIQPRWLETPREEERAELQQKFAKYAKAYYRRDPLWQLIPRLWTMSSDSVPVLLIHWLNAQEIKAQAWREQNYESQSMGDRVVMVAVHPRFGALTLGLFRKSLSGAFQESELDWLSAMAPLLFRLLFKHEGVRYTLTPRVDLKVVSGRLSRLGGGLTPREIQVCCELLLGLRYEDIAQKLSVKYETIKTFRNRAFAKLGVSSRFELFALLIG